MLFGHERNTMRAALLTGAGAPLVLVDDVELSGPGPGEVRVEVRHCGLCHSDLSAIDGSFPVPVPIVLGHEAAGVVSSVGADVESLAVGDHVVLTPNPACGRCYGCLRGEPGTCVNTAGILTFAMPDGTTRLSRGDEVVHRGLGVAAFAEEVIDQEIGAVRIPPEVPLDVACLIGCGVQTGVGAVLNTAAVEPGSSVVVAGLGGVGLSVVQGARLAGAATIIASDTVAERREMAQRFGATQVVDPASDDLVAAARDLTEGRGVDYAFEAVGRAALVTQLVDATRAGGTTVMVGAPPIDDQLDLGLAVLFGTLEKKLLGCLLGGGNSLREIPRLVSLWQGGQLDLESMVTTRRPIDEINVACDDLRRGSGVRTVLAL
jgi:Zn-dependent alcohol dehydrogenase